MPSSKAPFPSNWGYFYHSEKTPYSLAKVLQVCLPHSCKTTNLLSVSVELPVLDILCKWNHIMWLFVQARRIFKVHSCCSRHGHSRSFYEWLRLSSMNISGFVCPFIMWFLLFGYYGMFFCAYMCINDCLNIYFLSNCSWVNAWMLKCHRQMVILCYLWFLKWLSPHLPTSVITSVCLLGGEET